VTAGEKRQAVGYFFNLIKGDMRWLVLGLRPSLPSSHVKELSKSRYCGDFKVEASESEGFERSAEER
jgi:hypothetical protein